ncbi:MAG TPA: hypothetical protein VJT09_15660 [Pyrinomonadaceae bacterium]|nr:hypothetical protein [Pyrinomonadaceae bacterium]
MNARLRSLLIATLLTILAGAAQVFAQTDPLSALPTSDVVIFVDSRRIMTEIIPRVLAKDPATLAKLTGALAEVNQKTGINILSIERIVCGVRLLGPVGPKTKKEDVGITIIVRGDFNPEGLIAFLKKEGKGKQHEETYGGKIIYSEPPPDPPRTRTERATVAVTVLDPTTLVIGDLPQVRATIDAAAGNGRVDEALVRLATRDSSAVIGMAGNVPPSVAEDLRQGAPSDEMAQGILKLVGMIKQIFASIGATETDFNIITGMRLGSPEQAQSISDMLLGIRQQVSAKLPGQNERDLINSLQISAQNDEVQIRADIKNEIVQDLVASMAKPGKQTTTMKATPGKPRTTTKSRRGRRRRGR